MKKLAFAVSVGSLLGACAGAEDPNRVARPWNDSDYVTGSNLPRRDRSMPSDVETVSKPTLEQWQLPKPGNKSMPGGS